MLYVLITNGQEIDQICETLEDAKREAKDLRESFDSQVKIKKFETWAEVDSFVEKFEARH